MLGGIYMRRENKKLGRFLRGVFMGLVVFAALFAFHENAAAQGYPNRTVKIIVPLLPAGGLRTRRRASSPSFCRRNGASQW